jgi:hypothetical protein
VKKIWLKALLAACFATVLTATPVLASTSTDSVQGIEIYAGFKLGQYRIGATFVSVASGTVPGTLRASVNYTPNEPLVDSSGTNLIVGGNWRMNIIEGGSYKGYISGRIAYGGTVEWDETTTRAEVKADLVVTDVDVSGGYSFGKGDTLHFVGTLDHNYFPPRIGGTLTLP